MIAAILQSSYLPWLGVFDMLDQCDAFVLHNDLQYDKSWRNRNRIRTATAQGWSWLTVPVTLPGGAYTPLNEVRVNHDHPWQKKHLSLLRHNYAKARFFREYAGAYEEILTQPQERLVDLNRALLELTMRLLGIRCPLVDSTELHTAHKVKNDKIVAICRQVGADTWLANSACRNYVTPEPYRDAGIRVVYQDYQHPEYQQRFSPFVPYLSVLDLLFNHGPESLEIIRSGRTATPGNEQRAEPKDLMHD
jgi:hypothetical protein